MMVEDKLKKHIAIFVRELTINRAMDDPRELLLSIMPFYEVFCQLSLRIKG